MAHRHKCPSESLNEQPCEIPGNLRPGTRKRDEKITVYENCVYVKRAKCTHKSKCGELKDYSQPDEHVYEAPQLIRHRQRNRCPVVWLTVSVLLSVGVLCLTVYDVFFIDRSPSQCPLPYAVNSCVNKTLFCLQCSDMTVQIIREKEACLKLLVIITEDAVHKCCAGKATHLAALLELCVNLSQGTIGNVLKLQRHGSRFTLPSAHRRLLLPAQGVDSSQGRFYSKTGERTLRLDVNSTDSVSEHATGVQILPEGIAVQLSGLYYVYSSIHYKPSDRHAGENCKCRIWTHYVFRLSQNTPDDTGLLLETAYTACGMCHDSSETAFTGGVFFLKKGDLVQVEVSNLSMVEGGTASTFIGLMMLASYGT